MITTGLVVALLAAAPSITQPRLVTFDTADGGRIQAHLYESADRGVVLAHGAVFNKESWAPQAERLAAAGYTVLAIDFRGYGESVGGSDNRALYQDVLGGARFLESRGAGVGFCDRRQHGRWRGRGGRLDGRTARN